MWIFLICGLAFWVYAYRQFRIDNIFYPSIIFSFMWGSACVMTSLILGGFFGHLYLSDYYSFRYLNEYIPFFTLSSLCGFMLAHHISHNREVKLEFSLGFLSSIIERYRWVLWLNFFGGILRIILMVNLVGFDNIMDYRVAANAMMNTGMGPVGLVFRITSYIQMLANFYVALCGLQTGFNQLNLKDTIVLFVLYSPTQMATGGRLFVLYFILFYIGSFLLGRGIAIKLEDRPLLESTERRILATVTMVLLSIVSLIAMLRQLSYSSGSSSNGESPLAKFTYISEGILESEHYMRFNSPQTSSVDYGKHFLTGSSDTYRTYRRNIQKTYMSSIVMSIITPLYTSFGFYGSIIVWGLIAFIIEFFSIKCLNSMTIIRFFILLTLLKIMYESVMSNPIPGNVPVYELIILMWIFYKPIFGISEYEDQ